MPVDIKKRRTQLKLTLEQIGNYVGVSKSTVKKWENGYIKNMRRDKILLLAQILNVSPLDFLSLSEISKNSPDTKKELSRQDAKKIENVLGASLLPASIIYISDEKYIIKKLSDTDLKTILPYLD